MHARFAPITSIAALLAISIAILIASACDHPPPAPASAPIDVAPAPATTSSAAAPAPPPVASVDYAAAVADIAPDLPKAPSTDVDTAGDDGNKGKDARPIKSAAKKRLAMSDIRAVVDAHADSLRACGPTIGGGGVALTSWKVQPSGTVSDVSVASGVDSGVSSCVSSAVGGWNFPAIESEQKVSYPLRFGEVDARAAVRAATQATSAHAATAAPSATLSTSAASTLTARPARAAKPPHH
jgi:hypothetical protein